MSTAKSLGHKQKAINLEVELSQEMAATEIETFAYLLFQWWLRDFESKNSAKPDEKATE